MHPDADRQQQIDSMLALIATYWRLNPRLQFHELATQLIPGGAKPLDGPDRDDTTLHVALDKALTRQSLNNVCAKAAKHLQPINTAAELQNFALRDAHLRELHKTLLRAHAEHVTQLKQEMQAQQTPLVDYEIEANLSYYEADVALATRSVPFAHGLTSNELSEALHAIDTDNYADDPAEPNRQGSLTHDVISHSYGASPAIGAAGLLHADRVWIDFVVTRQYCLSLKSGAFDTKE